MKKFDYVINAIAAFNYFFFASDINKENVNKFKASKSTNWSFRKKLRTRKTTSQTSAVNNCCWWKRMKKLKNLIQFQTLQLLQKIQSGNDNLKWDVDFRTQVDNIQYKHADGSKIWKQCTLTNRLWLGMAYKVDDNSSFMENYLTIKHLEIQWNHSQSNTNPGSKFWLSYKWKCK